MDTVAKTVINDAYYASGLSSQAAAIGQLIEQNVKDTDGKCITSQRVTATFFKIPLQTLAYTNQSEAATAAITLADAIIVAAGEAEMDLRRKLISKKEIGDLWAYILETTLAKTTIILSKKPTAHGSDLVLTLEYENKETGVKVTGYPLVAFNSKAIDFNDEPIVPDEGKSEAAPKEETVVSAEEIPADTEKRDITITVHIPEEDSYAIGLTAGLVNVMSKYLNENFKWPLTTEEVDNLAIGWIKQMLKKDVELTSSFTFIDAEETKIGGVIYEIRRKPDPVPAPDEPRKAPNNGGLEDNLEFHLKTGDIVVFSQEEDGVVLISCNGGAQEITDPNFDQNFKYGKYCAKNDVDKIFQTYEQLHELMENFAYIDEEPEPAAEAGSTFAPTSEERIIDLSTDQGKSVALSCLFPGVRFPSILHVSSYLQQHHEKERTPSYLASMGTFPTETTVVFAAKPYDLTFAIMKMKEGRFYRIFAAWTDLSLPDHTYSKTKNIPDRWVQLCPDVQNPQFGQDRFNRNNRDYHRRY